MEGKSEKICKGCMKIICEDCKVKLEKSCFEFHNCKCPFCMDKPKCEDCKNTNNICDHCEDCGNVKYQNGNQRFCINIGCPSCVDYGDYHDNDYDYDYDDYDY